MIIKNILYNDLFKEQLNKLSFKIQKITDKKVEIFKINPLHPSLRIHQLQGKLKELWSISLNNKYRIIFKRIDNGDIVFISIGKLDIYKFL